MLWVLGAQYLKVWMLAPMIFGNFSRISINFQKNDVENVTNLVIPWQKVILSTHSLKFLTGAYAIAYQKKD